MADWYADGTSGHHGDGSKQAEPSRRRLIDTAYTAVTLAGYDGVTWREFADTVGAHHGMASSALSNLHRQGRITRLTEKRNRCGVYVLPDLVGGREEAPYKRNPPPPTRAAVEAGVADWWRHATPATEQALVDRVCKALGVES